MQGVVLALGLAHAFFEVAQATGLSLRQRQRFARVLARLRHVGGQRIEARGDLAAGGDELGTLLPQRVSQADGQQDDDDQGGDQGPLPRLAGRALTESAGADAGALAPGAAG